MKYLNIYILSLFVNQKNIKSFYTFLPIFFVKYLMFIHDYITLIHKILYQIFISNTL